MGWADRALGRCCEEGAGEAAVKRDAAAVEAAWCWRWTSVAGGGLPPLAGCHRTPRKPFHNAMSLRIDLKADGVRRLGMGADVVGVRELGSVFA
jgi:hypothetical protein